MGKKVRTFGKRPLSRLRLIIQLVSFGLLFYGGFAIQWAQTRWDPAGQASLQRRPAAGLKWAERREAVLGVHLPATACIYQRQGLCKGCSLFFVSDALTWQPSFEELVPYLLILLLFMLVFGRLWCGWVCPLGLLSDLLTRLRVALGIEQTLLRPRWRDGLVVTKYVLLILTLVFAALASSAALSDHRNSLMEPFCRICPSRIFAAFFSLDTICWTDWTDAITGVFTWLGLIAFGIFFIGLSVRRFWCRLCPIGGLTALCNRTGLVGLWKDGRKCTRCGSCERACPVDVRRVHEGRGHPAQMVTAYECTLCLRCVEACPEEGCLRFQWMGKTIRRS